jgi:hypothetical protein
MVWRSKALKNPLAANDALRIQSYSTRLGNNELVVHGYLKRYYNPSEPAGEIFVGIAGETDKPEDRIKWVIVPVDQVDDLVTALLYAKKLAIQPELRHDFRTDVEKEVK